MSEVDAGLRAGRRARRVGDAAPTLRRVSQAWVDGEAIGWPEAVASGRTPAERELTRQLQLLAALTDDTTTAAGRLGSRVLPAAPGFVARLLTALALTQVASALLAWWLAAAPATHAGRVLVLCSVAGAAAALRWRGTRRTGLVADVLWLVAAIVARPLLDLAASPAPGSPLHLLWQALYLEAWLPVACWRIARECPIVVRFTRFDRLSRGVFAAAHAWSLLLAAASVVAGLDIAAGVGWADALRGWGRQDPAGPFWMALLVWAGLLAVTVTLRTRQASADEARRTRTWGLLTLVSIAPLVVVAAMAGGWPRLALPGHSGDALAGVTLLAAMLAPWGLAAAALWQEGGSPRRGVVTTLERRLLPALVGLGAVSLVPLALRVLALQREPLEQIARDRLARGALLVAALSWLAAAALRTQQRAHRRPDRRGGNQEAALAVLANDLRHARTGPELATRLAAHLSRTLEVPRVAVAMPGPQGWDGLAGPAVSVPYESALAALLGTPGESPVAVGADAAIRRLLPPSDVQWLDGWGAEWLAPLAAVDGPPRAVVVVGARADGRALGRRAVALLSAAATTAAMALERCAEPSATPTAGDALAYECEGCGRLAAQAGACECGAPRRLALLPPCLHGKFRLERRIGAGGMGVVYLAVDELLGRLVALKTLPRLGAGAAVALHAEARTMAAVAHPSVAVLYGLEIWRDTPVLVVEYLGGGTLASRVAAGPMPLDEALSTGIALAEALADLHRRGWLHRDIKPSNIGFGRDGGPRLLDFGLTRLVACTRSAQPGAAVLRRLEVDATPPLAGTPMYLSPEALDGCDAGPHDDVWALALVVFEMIAGVHPFPARSLDGVRQRLRQATPVDVRVHVPSAPPALAALLTQALDPDRSRRLGTAADFAKGLRHVAAYR